MKKILNRDPKKRLSSSEILKHPWFNKLNENGKVEKKEDIQHAVEYMEEKTTRVKIEKEDQKPNLSYFCRYCLVLNE